MARRLRSLGETFTSNAVAETLSSDNDSTLAQRIAEQMTLLCPHVPAVELADLSSRLAFAELANASGVAFDHTEADEGVAPLGNHIVWLPGASSAIVLPAGEEEQPLAVVAARAGAWIRRHGASLSRITTRGSAAFRQVGTALVNAYQGRLHVQ
jgi:hypothetical protein